jgi:hypothetical protein
MRGIGEIAEGKEVQDTAFCRMLFDNGEEIEIRPQVKNPVLLRVQRLLLKLALAAS